MVDPHAVGRGVLAFVMVDANAWIGGPSTREALAAIVEVEETHIVAGRSSLLLKIRTSTTEALQDVLRRIFDIDGIIGTQTIVVLETALERAVNVGKR